MPDSRIEGAPGQPVSINLKIEGAFLRAGLEPTLSGALSPNNLGMLAETLSLTLETIRLIATQPEALGTEGIIADEAFRRMLHRAQYFHAEISRSQEPITHSPPTHAEPQTELRT